MPDVSYVFKKAKRKSANYAQKAAVLWPLMRRRAFTSDATVKDAQFLLQWWRRKLSVIKSLKWPDIQQPGKLQYMRNCPPAMVVAVSDKVMRVCNSNFCPWCYAREVEVLFNKLASLLPERGKATQPITLVEVSNRRIMSKEESGLLLDAHLVNWKRAPKSIITTLNPIGAYYSISLDPILRFEEYSWRLSYHVLALMPNDYVLPESLTTSRKRKVRITKVFSKKQLIPIIGRTCRYPTGLMKSDEALVIRALNARRGVRCKEYVRSLRNKKVKNVVYQESI